MKALHYLTYKKAAAYLDCEPSSLYNLVSQGRISFFKKKQGNGGLFCREILDAWVFAGQPRKWDAIVKPFQKNLCAQTIPDHAFPLLKR